MLQPNQVMAASVVLVVSRRWIGWFVAQNDGGGGPSEHQERLWLLHHPWEEDYLHWVGDAEQRRLHGTVPPPQDGRRHSTTRAGWCRGLLTEELQG